MAFRLRQLLVLLFHNLVSGTALDRIRQLPPNAGRNAEGQEDLACKREAQP